MHNTILRLYLRSATTFGSGTGVAGLVDREVEHDANGLPYLRGKTLKGLLAEECEQIVYLLEGKGNDWRECKQHLFGDAGSDLRGRGSMHIGDARLPAGLRSLLVDEIRRGGWTPEQILNSLTGIRRQTAMNEFGAPEHATLRSLRVLIRGLVLESEIGFEIDPTPQEWALLTAGVLALRRAGTGRNRGRGWLRAEIEDEGQTKQQFLRFAQEVKLA
jgi:CRISPR/Cas system CSM-associated protein Csm3 (group 7 of RAMP superfamily)